MEQIVLVTGGNRGIGYGIAGLLAKRGWSVVIGVRDVDAGQGIAEGLGSNVSAIDMDVSNPTSITAAVSAFEEKHPRLDVLVNNAGIYPDDPGDNVLDFDSGKFLDAMKTNVMGPGLVTTGFLPALRKSEGAQIIHLSSGYGQLDGVSADVPAYCLSKLTLNGLTIMQADALEGTGIRVNTVCPGWVRTDMGGPSAPRTIDEGADTVVWLACGEPDPAPNGKFFRNRKEIPW